MFRIPVPMMSNSIATTPTQTAKDDTARFDNFAFIIAYRPARSKQYSDERWL